MIAVIMMALGINSVQAKEGVRFRSMTVTQEVESLEGLEINLLRHRNGEVQTNPSQVQICDEISFAITSKDGDGYVSILSIGPSGAIYLLSPSSRMPIVRVTDSQTSVIGSYPVVPPTGEEHIMFIWTDTPVSEAMFHQMPSNMYAEIRRGLTPADLGSYFSEQGMRNASAVHMTTWSSPDLHGRWDDNNRRCENFNSK